MEAIVVKKYGMLCEDFLIGIEHLT